MGTSDTGATASPRQWRCSIRVLRRPFTTYSVGPSSRCIHISRHCPSIAEVPDVRVKSTHYEDVWALAAEEEARPCRMCALGSVLKTVCTLSQDWDAAKVNLVILSQPSVSRVGGVSLPSDLTVPTASGSERFVRLARSLGWPLVLTAAGPASPVALATAAAQVVESNVRAFRVPLPRPLTGVQTEIFCALVSDGCPEFGEGLTSDEALAAALALADGPRA